MGRFGYSQYLFLPLDLKYLFCDAPRVLDWPPGSPKFPRDHYMIGDTKCLFSLKKLLLLMSHPDSSDGLAEDNGTKGPGIETRSRRFFREIAIFFKMVQN